MISSTWSQISCSFLRMRRLNVFSLSLSLCTLGEPSRQTENKATRCKVERLQLLLQQRRLRRRARREPRAPYHWLSERKASRSHSNSSLSSDGSIDLDYDEALWKNDVQTDIGSEFVVAWTSNPPEERRTGEWEDATWRKEKGFTLVTMCNAGILFSERSIRNTKLRSERELTSSYSMKRTKWASLCTLDMRDVLDSVVRSFWHVFTRFAHLTWWWFELLLLRNASCSIMKQEIQVFLTGLLYFAHFLTCEH